MNITHICLAGLFMDGWGYQDNLIAKYHVSFGYDVTVITNRWVYDHEGNYVKTEKETETDRYGVKIVRIPIRGDKPYTYKLKHYIGLYETLCKTKPDVIFLHSTQIMDVEDIIRYKKENPDVKVYADNHCDYSNSATNWLSKYILHGVITEEKSMETESLCGEILRRASRKGRLYDGAVPIAERQGRIARNGNGRRKSGRGGETGSKGKDQKAFRL